MHRALPRLRERRGRLLANLLVGEAVVRLGVARAGGEQAGRHRRREDLGQDHDVSLLLSQLRPHRGEVTEAEAAPQDGGLGEGDARALFESRGPAVDQRAHGGGDEPLRVPGQRPDAVDLLDHPRLAVGADDLLRDERDAFGLGVEGGRGRGVHRRSQQLSEELARLGLREAGQPEPAQQAHALHVGDERHRLAHHGALFRPHGQHQEDRARGARADDVAEDPQRVLVRPLRVVDEDGQRRDPGERLQTQGRQIVGAQQSLVPRQGLQAGLGASADGVERPPERLRLESTGDRLPGARRGEDRPRHQEGDPQLLVGGHRDGDEPLGRGELGRGRQEPGLADPRLPFRRHARQPALARGRQLLLDGGDLGGTTDQGPGRAASVEGEGCGLGLERA